MIAKRVGRLANRILLFAHFIGAAAEHGFTVVDAAFIAQARYFPATAGALLCRFPQGARSVPPVPGGRTALYVTAKAAAMSLRSRRSIGAVAAVRLRPGERLDLNTAAFLDVVAQHRFVLAEGWRFRSSEGCARHRDAICSFFTPFERHLRRAREAVDPLRRRDRLVVGVHVRRGDYARFDGGRHLYSHEQYARLLREVQEAFPEREAAFLVCSDEPVPAEPFTELEVARGPGDEIGDLYALAACDLLLGPPSTYTTWASYYGEVPRYVVDDPGERVRREAFAVARGLATPAASVRPAPERRLG